MTKSRENLVFANLTERMFVWTPPKTASHTAAVIFPKLGFNTYNSEGNYLIPNPVYPHNHTCILPFGHEKYYFITTIRNPYNIMVSLFKNVRDREYWNSDSFEDYLYAYFYNEELPEMFFPCYDYSERIPDYFIRVENMYEDYLKLPFVKQSDYYKSGDLERDCSVKENSSDYTDFDWKSLYNQNNSDIVFYNYAHLFEIFGYDRNSWKK